MAPAHAAGILPQCWPACRSHCCLPTTPLPLPPPHLCSAAGALRVIPSRSLAWAGAPPHHRLGQGPVLPGPFQKLSKPPFSEHSCPSVQCPIHPPSSAPLPRPRGIGPRCLCDALGLREELSCLGPHPKVWGSEGRCSRGWKDRLSPWPLWVGIQRGRPRVNTGGGGSWGC